MPGISLLPCYVLFERGVLFCVMCVILVLCLIAVPLPPGKNSFTVKINNNSIQFFVIYVPSRQLQG
jgi:hypothetical protein